jgi:hypothetical protein
MVMIICSVLSIFFFQNVTIHAAETDVESKSGYGMPSYWVTIVPEEVVNEINWNEPTPTFYQGTPEWYKLRETLSKDEIGPGNETAEFAAYAMNEKKELALKLLSEEDIVATLKKPSHIDFNILKQEKHVTSTPGVKDSHPTQNPSQPLQNKKFLEEYTDFVKTIKAPPFDAEKHIDDLTNDVLGRLADLDIGDNDVEAIKFTTMETLNNDPRITSWRINLEQDIRNDNHPANKMVAICTDVSMNCSQSPEPEKQMIAVVMAHIGTCITLINAANVLEHDPFIFLNQEVYDLTYAKFFN